MKTPSKTSFRLDPDLWLIRVLLASFAPSIGAEPPDKQDAEAPKKGKLEKSR